MTKSPKFFLCSRCRSRTSYRGGAVLHKCKNYCQPCFKKLSPPEITRKTIEDKLRGLKLRLEPLLDKNGYVLGSGSQQIDVQCIRSQIWLLEEILKGGE